MNKKLFKGTISVMLLFVAASLNAQNFSKSFNQNYKLLMLDDTAKELFFDNNF
jgi:hypothetical protein